MKIAPGRVAAIFAALSVGVEAQDAQLAPELLPQVMSGVMEAPNENACPTWSSTTQAKEIVAFLTGAIAVYADADQSLQAASGPATPAGANASMARTIGANRSHIQAMTACRDGIAEKLGMDSAAVQRLYQYNTLTADETMMFSELENNYSGQPSYFSKLLAMPDQRKAQHLIDLELREVDFGLAAFREMIVKDAGKPTEETDRRIFSRTTRFRSALLIARTSIAKKTER